MLISHKYKFIFIRTRKTAGSSFEKDISKILPKIDVVVPYIPKNTGYHTSFFQDPFRKIVWKYLPLWELYRFLPGKLRYIIYGDDLLWGWHMPATHVKKLIGEEIFNSYFKFCVEREPVDKCISMYWYKKNRYVIFDRRAFRGVSWEEYICNPIAVDTNLWTDEAGDLMVDRILRYENLDEEIRQVARELGIPFEGIKSRIHADKRRPGIKVSEEQREKIYQAFAESNRHTGYKIEDYKIT